MDRLVVLLSFLYLVPLHGAKRALLEPQASEAVSNLLPEYVQGDLSALCVWPDQIRHWYKYKWTSPLHFIDTPDDACSFTYSRDCHDQHGVEDMCVAGAVKYFTSQLLHYREGTADRRYNMTEALLFLSHFMGDIHQRKLLQQKILPLLIMLSEFNPNVFPFSTTFERHSGRTKKRDEKQERYFASSCVSKNIGEVVKKLGNNVKSSTKKEPGIPLLGSPPPRLS
ncbi:unnamed protein product [Lupinus luteus]|uniref:Aspergillus nuclease S1 n=1 Tax=Lupinus luteus TaxID=3873 RepID=A0AAV1WYX6_LUPLU